MGSFVDFCFRIPNLGVIAFIIVFIVMIPLFIFNSGNIDVFKYYFPFLVMLAITLTESSGDGFNNLYPTPPTNISGFMSVNLINGLALIGLLGQCVTAAVTFNSVKLGVILGLITFAITFPMAQQILPFFIREGSRTIEENTNFRYPGNWHKYFIGMAFIIFLLGVEYILIIATSQYVFSNPGSSNSLFNSKGLKNNLSKYN
jgi:hypothetical protein